MKIKNIEKRGNRKEGVNLIIEVLEKDVIPKGNRKLLSELPLPCGTVVPMEEVIHYIVIIIVLVIVILQIVNP